ncbi:MAG TPA: hypothetical protein VHT34_12865 [Clostridia bacterium]|nr:hypothetical protein [Clostridia bacterium]
MEYTRYRKHPRVYKKNSSHEESILDLSVTTAAGIVAAIFVGGAVLGFCLKHRWHN